MKTRLIMSLLLLPVFAAAQLSDLRLPISLVAESTDYDGKNSMIVFKSMRLTQGNIGVEADEGSASELDFQDAVWQFVGNVMIDVENGHIECDTADLRFSNHQLKFASITGQPATFEFKRPDSDQITRAAASQLSYDLDAGTIEFSGNATLTEGDNEFSSHSMVYNIKEQRVLAQSSEEGGDRVRITYTPPEIGAEEDPDQEAQDDVEGGEQNQ